MDTPKPFPTTIYLIEATAPFSGIDKEFYFVIDPTKLEERHSGCRMAAYQLSSEGTFKIQKDFVLIKTAPPLPTVSSPPVEGASSNC